ncbi:MAG: hypothetical protein M1819_002051 [Sarea resinae]|nr:MAG: hypothetical protein M1819_002051 [Sarea resinae]
MPFQRPSTSQSPSSATPTTTRPELVAWAQSCNGGPKISLRIRDPRNGIAAHAVSANYDSEHRLLEIRHEGPVFWCMRLQPWASVSRTVRVVPADDAKEIIINVFKAPGDDSRWPQLVAEDSGLFTGTRVDTIAIQPRRSTVWRDNKESQFGVIDAKRDYVSGSLRLSSAAVK